MNPKKILFIKLSSLGDVLMTIPVAEALKGEHPTVTLGWVTEEGGREVLEDYTALDKLYLFEKKKIEMWAKKGHFVRIIGYLRRFIREIKKENWEMSVDFQSLFRSSLIPFLARVPRRAASLKGINKLMINDNIPYSTFPGGHAIDWYHHLASSVGLISPERRGRFFFPLSEAKKNAAHAGLKQYKRPFVGMAPFSKWESKNWPEEYYRDVARWVTEERGGTVFLYGGVAEKAKNDRIIEGLKNVVNKAGELSLSEFAASTGEMDLFLSGDSGPMHIAAAMGVKQFSFFGPTNPKKTGPYNEKARLFRILLDCSPCFQKICPREGEKMVCMNDLTSGMIIREIEKEI
ncbi:MAG TPA: glycosyltransferase family 9 protein [Firmicutes bacterium]|nr:glycosyltransferase family 9 protein [Bacillota bacterium]